MDPDVLAAREVWRSEQAQIDELVDLFVQRLPVDPEELVAREAAEFFSRRAYYVLLQQRYGFPPPPGLQPPGAV